MQLTNEQILVRLKKHVPCGTQTLSKAAEKYVKGVYPVVIAKGQGCMVEDPHGNLYVDYISALGPVILGYKHQAVTKAVKEAIEAGGPVFSLPHISEGNLAAQLASRSPIAEKSRFFKTGSDVTSAAIRVARAFTGKEVIAVCGYHGWHDWYAISTDRPQGIPLCLEPTIRKFNYNDPQSLLECFKDNDVAAVILEPVVYDAPKDNFLSEVVRIAHEHDALVIFDEIVTGFRFGAGGAASYFDVQPDLVCYSKAMANGFPLGALCGRKETMQMFERPDVLISGTFGGDIVSIAAATATLMTLDKNDSYAVKRIWSTGNRLKDSYNDLCKMLDIPSHCRGFAPRTDFVFEDFAHKALFWQECVKAGILFGYANFVSAAHSMITLDATIGVMESSLRYVKEHWNNPRAALEGEMPQSPFVKR